MSANAPNAAYIIVITRSPTTVNTTVIAVDQCVKNALVMSTSHGMGADIVKAAAMVCTMAA